MKILQIWLLVFATLPNLTYGAPKKPIGNWQVVFGELGLLTSKTPPPEKTYFSELGGTKGRALSEDEKALFARDSSGEWERFSDEWLSFDLPKNDLLNVETFTPEEKPKLRGVGGAVGTSDRSFQKVYRLTIGKDRFPYGMVFLSDNTWFDEGVCFCGAIKLKTLAHHDGNLIELSQLGDTAIKKVEVINDTHRAILFEWTHSALTQNAYARIACSLRLNTPSSRTRKEWIRYSQEMRELEGGIGWLRKGMTVEQIKEHVGAEPKASSPQSLRYTKEIQYPQGARAQDVFTFPLLDGKLTSFSNSWTDYEDLPALYGSNFWVGETLGPRFDDEKTKAWSIKPGDLEFILKKILEEGPQAKDHHWETICEWIHTLAERGIKKTELIELVAKRAFINELPQSGARWVLEIYEHPDLKKFVTSRLNFVLGDSQLGKSHREETWNLFSSLERGDPGAAELVRKAANSKDEKVRVPGIDRASWLPKDEARELLKKALGDQSSHLRFFAIGELSEVFDRKDKEWLEKAWDEESDGLNRRKIKETIKSLK